MDKERAHNGISRLLKWGVWLRAKTDLQGRFGIYVYAIIMGVLSAFIAVAFRYATKLIQKILTGSAATAQLEAFSSIPKFRIILALGVGGLISGAILSVANKYGKKPATPYMEAVSIGNGYIPVKVNLLRTLASIITIGSGASIGREGPLLQTAAVAASYAGRSLRLSVPRLRLAVACAAAGGMAAVFHTPLAGALFVGEIVIGVLTIDLLAPLLLASCTSFLIVGALENASPIYEALIPAIHYDFKLAVYCAILGLAASIAARFWLAALDGLEKLFNSKRNWLPAKLALAGVAVGCVAAYYPHILGNGAHIIRGIMSMSFDTEFLTRLFVLKIFAVAIFFGMGAVGGVLTPSLTLGCILGLLYSQLLCAAGFSDASMALPFAIIGMAAFFTTAAAAPITSILLVIEFTMAGHLIFPLIMAVLVSYGTAKLLGTKGMYSSALSGQPNDIYNRRLQDVKLIDVFKKTTISASLNTPFKDIAKKLLKNPMQNIYVVSAKGRYIGSIIPDDILSFIDDGADFQNAAIAYDIMRADAPMLTPQMGLLEAIKIFYDRNAQEALPIVDPDTKILRGAVNKTDLLIIFNEITRREKLL